MAVNVDAQTASFIGIGSQPVDQPGSWALGISGDGSVVVGQTNGTHDLGWTNAFRWANGSIEILKEPGGQALSDASAVSGNGQVIVGAGAYRWTLSEGVTTLLYSNGDPAYGKAAGVSFDGSVIAGEARVPGTANTFHAFRWTNGTGVVDLGTLPGGTHSSASSVSADGKVVVGSSYGSRGYEAFRWSQDDGMVSLGLSPGGGHYDDATAVSADGSVIVGHVRPGVGGYDAFRWTASTGMVMLGDLPGGLGSTANAVSPDGWIVAGESYYNAAFIWDPVHGMRNLQDLLENDFGLNLDGWYLASVNGMAVSGGYAYFTGNAGHPFGTAEGFIVAVPLTALPEPGAMLLLGLVSLAFHRPMRCNDC